MAAVAAGVSPGNVHAKCERRATTVVAAAAAAALVAAGADDHVAVVAQGVGIECNAAAAAAAAAALRHGQQHGVKLLRSVECVGIYGTCAAAAAVAAAVAAARGISVSGSGEVPAATAAAAASNDARAAGGAAAGIAVALAAFGDGLQRFPNGLRGCCRVLHISCQACERQIQSALARRCLGMAVNLTACRSSGTAISQPCSVSSLTECSAVARAREYTAETQKGAMTTRTWINPRR